MTFDPKDPEYTPDVDATYRDLLGKVESHDRRAAKLYAELDAKRDRPATRQQRETIVESIRALRENLKLRKMAGRLPSKP